MHEPFCHSEGALRSHCHSDPDSDSECNEEEEEGEESHHPGQAPRPKNLAHARLREESLSPSSMSRFYRLWITDTDLVSFNIVVKQTNLYIRAQHNLKDKAFKSVMKHRHSLEGYIQHHPLFLTTLEPYPVEQSAPAVIKEMATASQIANTGPMSAVAGAIAEAVGRDLLHFSAEIIVENGGDVFLRTSKKRLVGIYAGESPFSGKIALEIKPEETPLGICTSSATIGHSLSLGCADAVVTLSPSTPLADATATAIGNMVKNTDAIPQAIEKAKDIPGLYGIIIIKDDKMGVWGKVKIVPLFSH